MVRASLLVLQRITRNSSKKYYVDQLISTLSRNFPQHIGRLIRKCLIQKIHAP